MAVQIQMRRDTAANWTSNNPTLAAGEWGLETDTGKFKIGDGSTAWNVPLAYSSLPSNVLSLAGGTMTGAIATNSTFDGVDVAVRDAVLTTTTTTANAALPTTGGTMTGAIATNSTFDGVDIATRDAILTSTTTTANAALPATGGTLAGVTLSGTVAGADQIIQKPMLKDVGETVKTIASSSSDPSLDIHDGNVFKITLDNSPTFTITNPTATGSSCSITLFLLQDGTGSRIVTWPNTVKWAGGTAPTLTTTASRYDIIVLTTIDAGTTWFGAVSGQDFS